ncbi:MAG: TIM barrel protein [Pseudomonadota bacterium]
MRDRITEVGFSGTEKGADGDLALLERGIAERLEMGATVCELMATRLDAVSGCRLVAHRVAALRAVLARHATRYTLHAPIAVNLMDEAHRDLQIRAAEASLELAAECEARIAVFHPGRVHPSVWADQSETLLAREREALAGLGDRAQALGVTIAYENMSPNRHIIAGNEASYALSLAALAAQLGALDHPHVVACLDVSHAQQGAVLQGFDLFEGVAALAPHVGHLHFSDCTGVPSTIRWDEEGERLFFGVGDMHAPPGFGRIDFDRLADRLTIRPGSALVIELKVNHFGHSARETLGAAQAFAARVNALNA